MSKANRTEIACPECGASLVVVRIKVPPSTSDRAPCPACASFLLPRDGDDLLQYEWAMRPAQAGGPAKVDER